METVEGAPVVGHVPQEEFPMASPAPQPPAPEPPGKPAPPPADRPPPDPVAANPKPAEEGALFRALVDAGVEAMLAYTVEKRMHAMTSETAAAQIQPVLAELREMRESTVTKADLAEFATKADLAENSLPKRTWPSSAPSSPRRRTCQTWKRAWSDGCSER